MAKTSLPKISIVGAGRVGTSLALAFFERGYTIASIINRTGKPALSLAKVVKCKKVSTQIEDIDPSSEIIVLAVSDVSIADVAKRLAQSKKLKHKKLFVLHTSGVMSSAVLQPLGKKGTLIASMHPIQTFGAGKKRTKVNGIFFGIEGTDAAISRTLRLVNDLGSHAVVIPAAMKPLYHIACVFASSYFIVILNTIRELAGQLNIKAHWTDVFGPLMTNAMENAIKNSSADALTGPVVRRDLSTLEIHLDALATSAPHFLPLYTVAGIEVARIAKEHGKMSREDFQTLITEFRQFIKTMPQHLKERH